MKIIADFDQTMGAKFIDVEFGNNFLMVTGVLENRDRSATNHHIYIQFTIFYILQFLTHQNSPRIMSDCFEECDWTNIR